MHTPKRCYGYARVSTIKQGEGVSLEAQRDAIEAYAARNNLKIVRWFEEKVTAAKIGRPAFSAMVRLLLKRGADGVILHKVDRGARNLRDWASIADLSDAGVDVHFATESLDFRSRGGRLTADIQAVIAADFIRNLRDETIKGLRGRLKQGLYPWQAPLGYRNNGGGKPKTLDPVLGPQIARIFELYASGQHSLKTLVREMNSSGFRSPAGRPLSKVALERILTNPFYCGVIKMRSSEETFPGIHEPLISVSLFEAAKDVREGKSGKKLVKHAHLFNGLFRCAECHYFMTPERQRGHVYYRCHTVACVTKGVREEAIDAKVQSFLAGLVFSAPDLKILERQLRELGSAEVTAQARRSLGVQLSQGKERLSRIADAYIEQKIDDAMYHDKRERELLEIRRVEAEIGALADERDLVGHTLEFLERAKNIAALYSLANTSEKRELVSLASSNRWVDGKDVVIEPSIWLLSLKSGHGVSQCDPTRPAIRMPIQHIMHSFREHRHQVERFMDLFDRHLPREERIPRGRWLLRS